MSSFLRKFSFMLSLLLATSLEAQERSSPAFSIAACRTIYSTWDAQSEALKIRGESAPGPSAEEQHSLERLAGRCLQALQNDLESIEKTENWWEQRPTEAQRVEARVADLQESLGRARPQWHDETTLHGEAIGAPVDYRSPGDYLRDAGLVSKKWFDLARRFAPVLEGRILRMRRVAGLAVDTRDCRSLWLMASAGKRRESDDSPPPQPSLNDKPRIGFCLRALQNDLETLDKHLRSLPTQPKSIKVGDVKTWDEPTLQGAAIGSVQSVEVDIDKYLVDGYLVHKYKRWIEIEREVAPGLKDAVESVMSFRGLRDLFSLLLTTDMVLLDMRDDGDDIFVSEDAKAKTFPTAVLFIESDHFLAEEFRPAHLSFGGQIAALPVLNLLNQQPPEGSTLPADEAERIYPTFQQALVWDLKALAHSAFKRFEVSLGGFLGQSILLDDKSLIERDKDFVGIPLENGTGRAEIFKGFFVELRAYDLDFNIIHGEHSYLNPRFSIAYGHRWNDRFVPETGSSIPSDSWKESRVFRFRWNIRNSLASRDKYQGPLLVTFSFGVEREWWPGNAGLPTITSVFFSGDFDLKKIIKGKD